MYSFKNDYSEGAHPKIIETLARTNLTQQEGYGDDDYCKQAAELIRKKLKSQSDVHFVSGGTHSNLIVISSMLKPFESVIAAKTAHINVHESGAIEATGHKIHGIETEDGKITPEQIQPLLDFHCDEHMVKPRLVFISNSTEIGTIYQKKELEALHVFCKNKGLLLYMDGARLGSALASQENDLTFADLSRLVDVFYIGGTKNGALLGEAIVINNDHLQDHFRFHLKQRGALLAKGRVLGIQFLELFKDDLYLDLARHANAMASKLSHALKESGYLFLQQSSTNQIFPILPNSIIKKLKKKHDFYVWCSKNNNTSTIRLVTSWATREEAVDEFIADLQRR